jgi:hypothetical protein
MVKLRKPFLVAACFAVISGFFAFNVNANEWDKATLITTNQPMEVPGRVLPAGKYMFRLMDSLSNRQIVQIMSDDQTKLYQTVLAIPDYRMEAADRASITFYETPRGSVSPVQSWFYAGERSGVEFVYPKERAAVLAEVTGENVPSAEAAVTKEQPGPALLEKPKNIEQAPASKPESEIAALNTEPKVPGVETPEAQAPAPEEPRAAPAPATLPKTASPDALFLLTGLGSALAAFGIRRLRS